MNNDGSLVVAMLNGILARRGDMYLVDRHFVEESGYLLRFRPMWDDVVVKGAGRPAICVRLSKEKMQEDPADYLDEVVKELDEGVANLLAKTRSQPTGASAPAFSG